MLFIFYCWINIYMTPLISLTGLWYRWNQKVNSKWNLCTFWRRKKQHSINGSSLGLKCNGSTLSQRRWLGNWRKICKKSTQVYFQKRWRKTKNTVDSVAIRGCGCNIPRFININCNVKSGLYFDKFGWLWNPSKWSLEDNCNRYIFHLMKFWMKGTTTLKEETMCARVGDI